MLYAITDRRLYGANETFARERLLEQAAVWAANGVAFIQLREKDLAGRDQVELARAMMEIIRKSQKQSGTRLLINGRPDVALAAGADGVHLPAGSNAITPEEVRSVFSGAGCMQRLCISISCHTLEEVESARQQQPDCILFAPVFEKAITEHQHPEGPRTLPGTGLQLLKQACRLAAPTPVFALGGVTAENAQQCINAGSTGVAAIRLMQAPTLLWVRLA